MLDTYIRAKIDAETKKQAIKTLKAMGISISDYIRMAVIQVVNKKTIPFSITEPNTPNELTIHTIEKSERGEGLNKAKDTEDFFKKLGV